MDVVYEPKGRAKEYADLACNLYRGCTHGCLYCYAPACVRVSTDEWHSLAQPRRGILSLLEKDAQKLCGDSRRVLFSFLSDPYQPLEREAQLTRQSLEICHKYGLKSQVLTKGSAELMERDLPLMREAGVQLGITISFIDDTDRKKWEPRASAIGDRLAILKKAHKNKVFTWVSIEPVIDPEQAYAVVETAHEYVDFWKVGKLNHMKEYEGTIDWVIFRNSMEAFLKRVGANYYIKQELRLAVAKSSSSGR